MSQQQQTNEGTHLYTIYIVTWMILIVTFSPEVHSLTGCDTVSVMYGLWGNCYESAYKVSKPI